MDYIEIAANFHNANGQHILCLRLVRPSTPDNDETLAVLNFRNGKFERLDSSKQAGLPSEVIEKFRNYANAKSLLPMTALGQHPKFKFVKLYNFGRIVLEYRQPNKQPNN